MNRIIQLTTAIIFIASVISAQTDTVKYQWPVQPLNSSQTLNATFGEFRNTESSDHFHNAVDIGEPDGSPVYASMGGSVYSIVNSSSNSYVSVITQIDGKYKRLTYLHIVPNSSLYVGKTVTKGIDVLGTIYSGMGHVHLIERELVSNSSSYAVEINNIREGGGLDPYVDTWSPIIYTSTLKFRVSETEYEMPADGLSGRVDMIIRVEEQNGSTSIGRNNGAYSLGYRIWSADTTEIVYEPADNGVKYRFDRLPSNSYVHNVFVKGMATLSDPIYWLTNGNGADGINNSLTVSKNYFDSDQFEPNDYILEIFSEDTRHNSTQAFVSIKITGEDVIPPARPVLGYIKNHNKKQGVTTGWIKNTEPDLMGYRLYYTGNTTLTDWKLAADENMMTREMDHYEIESPADFIDPASGYVYFFKITAVDSSGNESEESDIYSRSSYIDGSEYPTCLIVDGFDRTAGSWKEPTHSFNISYFAPITYTDSIVVSSCSNDAVMNGSISLSDYDAVIWFVGDESTEDRTFKSLEQHYCALYLESGGKLFVSGSEIGWDLGRTHNYSEASDTLFYYHYLKAKLVNDGNSDMNKVTGASSTLFSNVSMSIGQAYAEDYPDDIDPINGSETILYYNTDRDATTKRKAGVAYTGTFGESTIPGQIIYLPFAMETSGSFTERIKMMTHTFEYFDIITSVKEENVNKPNEFKLMQNYPNPFNPSTNLEFVVDKKAKVSLNIFDILGRKIAQLTNDIYSPGKYKIQWNAGKFASGVYFARLQSGEKIQTIRMMLIK